jgi:hypothetical protein
MAERIQTPSLPVPTPRHLVITDLVDASVGAGRHSPCDELVGLINEDLDSHRSRAK